MKKVIVAGASGLIGSELITLLLNEKNIDRVVALVRNRLELEHPKLEQMVLNFDDLEQHKDFITGFALYCCLGTTRAKTPSPEEFRKIDYVFPTILAKLAAANGIEQFHIVTALGANPKSIIFYSRLKGEVEEFVKAQEIKSIHIYQPSLLIGERREKRPGERAAELIMNAINPLLRNGLEKYRSIKAITVAQAIFNQTLKNIEGVHVYPSHMIGPLA